MSVRLRLALAWIITALGGVLAVLGVMPPPTMLAVRFVVLGDEASPIFLLYSLGTIPAVLLLARASSRRQRAAMLICLVAAAALELQPIVGARRIADARGYSFARALTGDTATADVSERRVAYAAGDGSPLALLLLHGPTGGLRPTIVVIYGGAWRGGVPEQAIDVSRHFARRGYTVAAIDYRHAPAHRHPAQIQDVRIALSMLRDSAAVWGIDTTRVSIVGRSAGGHLALLAAYAPVTDGSRPLTARSVVGFYAPYDLAEAYRDPPSPDPIGIRGVLTDFLGGSPEQMPERYRDASPSTYVRAGLPPTLLIYARHDHLVLARFGREAATALSAQNSPVKYVELGWAEHGFDLLPGGVGSQVALDLLAKFFTETLR